MHYSLPRYRTKKHLMLRSKKPNKPTAYWKNISALIDCPCSLLVLQKYPLQKLRCPRDLPEADFLDLLKSTYPQLGADKPLAMFSMRRSRRLCPLKVNSLTPDEIYSLVKSCNIPAVYIQQKVLVTNQHYSDILFI